LYILLVIFFSRVAALSEIRNFKPPGSAAAENRISMSALA
jgi:hypothetical protein